MNSVITPGDPKKIFELYEPLGSGTYATVFRAKNTQNSKIVAVKKITFEGVVVEDDILKEITVLQACHNENIVEYYGTYKETDKTFWIAMELCAVGSVLSTYEVLGKTVSEDELAFILYKVLLGLKYLHSQNRIHRDIKADNVLITTEGRIKIADFGVSATLDALNEKRKTVTGTPFWMAPEVIEETGHDCKADLWSLGITAIEMMEGKPPHGEMQPVRALMAIPMSPPPTLKNPGAVSAEMNDFIAKCLVKDPDQRWTAEAALKHPLITGKAAKLNESVLAPRIKEVTAKRAAKK